MMLRRAVTVAAFLLSAISLAVGRTPIDVTWRAESCPEGGYYSVFEFTNNGDSEIGSEWSFRFNVMWTRFTADSGSGFTASPVLEGDLKYWELRPESGRGMLSPGESCRVRLHSDETFAQTLYNSPSGGHFLMTPGGESLPVAISLLPPSGLLPGIASRRDYADGTFLYSRNEAFASANPTHCYDMIPSLKSVVARRGSAMIPAEVSLKFSPDAAKAAAYMKMKLPEAGMTCSQKAGFTISLSVEPATNDNYEYYRLSVRRSGVEIVGQSETGAMNGAKTLVSILKRELPSWHGLPVFLPCTDIEDWPELHHRGFMLDIARNYIPHEKVLKLIDILAEYKINVLQYHFNDDEAWRLEIPGLPELTEMASRRGCTDNELESGFLVQSYTGTGSPDDFTTSANGHLTREQFVSMLEYADARGVSVVPELEMPGHSRAAIMAMKYRASRSHSDSFEYRLWDDSGQPSGSVSVQGWGDNAVCVAEEGVYRFWDKVIGEIQKMYDDAGVPLRTVHIGGDEVSHGVWMASPKIRRLMEKEGLSNGHEIHAWFVRRMAGILAGHGLKIAGWQEVALGRSEEYDREVSPRVAYINTWDTLGDRDSLAYEFANRGYPVVLTNVRNFYLDMYYAANDREPGALWGGTVDEFSGFACQPFNNYSSARTDQNGLSNDFTKAAEGKPGLAAPENIIGVEGALWAETIRNSGMVEYYLFPKILGVVERGWNACPEWGGKENSLYDSACADFNLKIGVKELPYLTSRGVSSRIAPPGAIVSDGLLMTNTPYPGMTVRYTLDGTEPTMLSPVWTEPVRVGGNARARVKAWYCGGESVTVDVR